MPQNKKPATLIQINELLKLEELLVEQYNVANFENTKFQNISTDNRTSKEGDLFIAYKGVEVDSHDFIPSAIERGVKAVVCEEVTDHILCRGIPILQVKNSRKTWAFLEALLYSDPQNSLTFIGITGTNGKTTTSYFLKQCLEHTGIKSLTIGTNGYWLDTTHYPSRHTTPDPNEFYEILAKAKDAKISTVIMEVSSHAIAQEKLAPIKFQVGVFVSFSQDHLDLHGSMEAYWACKAYFLRNMIKKDGYCLAHKGVTLETYAPPLPSNTEEYGEEGDNDVVVKLSDASLGGMTLKVTTSQWQSKGKVSWFTKENSLNFSAALAVCFKISGRLPKVETWQQIHPAAGRLDVVVSEPFTGIVDFAHTPDGLEKLLKSIKPLLKGRSRLILVFGCGGDRDKGKRPQMGSIAAKYADLTILTNDNPRREDPQAIINEISAAHHGDKLLIPNRREAIEQAVLHASESDVIVVAGKGHENYQIIGSEEIPFSDSQTLENITHGSREK